MTEKMRYLEEDRERGESNEHRQRQHTEHGERDHDADPLERWSQQRARQIKELAEAGRHEEARELERDTKRIVEERMRHRHEQERGRQQKHEELRRFAHEREREIEKLAEDGRHEEAVAAGDGLLGIRGWHRLLALRYGRSGASRLGTRDRIGRRHGEMTRDQLWRADQQASTSNTPNNVT